MPVSVHGGLGGGVMVGLVLPKIFCQSSAFSRQLGFWMRCPTRWIDVVCRGFIGVVLSDFSMDIVLSWISRVFINGRFSSARMASLGVMQSWPMMARPALCCDLSRFSNVEFNILVSCIDAPYSTFECPVTM